MTTCPCGIVFSYPSTDGRCRLCLHAAGLLRWRTGGATPSPWRYFVVPAPGHYGDSARVLSSHKTLEAAAKAAGPGLVVRTGSKRKGETWHRASETVYPEART